MQFVSSEQVVSSGSLPPTQQGQDRTSTTNTNPRLRGRALLPHTGTVDTSVSMWTLGSSKHAVRGLRHWPASALLEDAWRQDVFLRGVGS